MIYDCFIVFNELDLCEIRFNVLKDVVDKFVVVEGTLTHTGKPKPLYFHENRERFAAFKDKIIHVVVDDFPAPPAGYSERDASWMRENFQRNAILRGLKDAKPSDLVMISDVDEIPRPEMVREELPWAGISVCEQRFMNFYVNYMDHVRPRWKGTRILRMAVLQGVGREVESHYAFIEDFNRGMTPTRVRFARADHNLKDAGWHFSYLGGKDAIMKKIRSVGLEYGSRYSLDDSALQKLIERGDDITRNGGRFFAVPLDSSFPNYIVAYADKYASMIYRPTKEYLERTKWVRVACVLRGRVHRAVARLIPRAIKPAVFRIYCLMTKEPINQ